MRLDRLALSLEHYRLFGLHSRVDVTLLAPAADWHRQGGWRRSGACS